MIFAPFAIGLVTAFTVGYGGAAGLIALSITALRTDVTPGAPKSMPVPPPDLPAMSD
jgi:hypothetical protein